MILKQNIDTFLVLLIIITLPSMMVCMYELVLNHIEFQNLNVSKGQISFTAQFVSSCNPDILAVLRSLT